MTKDKYTCPVMGHPVEDIETAPSSTYQGKSYYFCCPPCKNSFDKDPEKYLNGESDNSGGPHPHHH